MSDKTKIEPLSDDQIALIRMVHEDARKFHDVEHCDGCHLLANLDALLADRARLEARVQAWETAVWMLYGKPNDPVLTMCCRGCHQCRTIYAGTNGDPIVGDMQHGFGCWIAPLLTEPTAATATPARGSRIVIDESAPPTERADRCPTCEGTGVGRKPARYVCEACGGSGIEEPAVQPAAADGSQDAQA